MAFHVGQKVVCVDVTPKDQRMAPGGYYLPNWPRLNGVHTIRDISEVGGVLLCEVVNPVRLFSDGEMEGNFDPARFRPLIEKSTDTGFAILEEIRRRETLPAEKPRVTAPASLSGGPS